MKEHDGRLAFGKIVKAKRLTTMTRSAPSIDN
jgi:hypothetical protein